MRLLHVLNSRNPVTSKKGKIELLSPSNFLFKDFSSHCALEKKHKLGAGLLMVLEHPFPSQEPGPAVPWPGAPSSLGAGALRRASPETRLLLGLPIQIYNMFFLFSIPRSIP